MGLGGPGGLRFNKRCFLRSRSSMEMWCPDDMGRDSWDWVGPPTWGRACFNSPEWGGGSSPVETEPSQIALFLSVCFTVSLLFNACDVTTKLVPDAPSPGRIQLHTCWDPFSHPACSPRPSSCSWGRMSRSLLSQPDRRELLKAPSQKHLVGVKMESVLRRLAKLDSDGASSPSSAR